jgi:two-component system, chemotaxis family, CheB/CheR fusion protein
MSPAETKPGFHCVGIGASAGGLEALEKFFGVLPVLPGFAFVVVQHLSPDYKSLMADLLAKHTELPVIEARDGEEIIPGHVYLIPRKKNMNVYKGRLFLSEKGQGLNLPIDIFLRSLAEDFSEKAVGIILSGTGSDGTRGVRAVKETGGMVMVQSVESAKFDGMPRSAISTGIADYVLPVEDLARELQSYAAAAGTPDADRSAVALSDAAGLSRIFMLIRRTTGADLSEYKSNTVERRIERRIGINHVGNLSGYLHLLEENPDEVKTLFKEILIGVTRFFRDNEAFSVIRETVLPEMLNGKESGEPVRIWIPGCSTGEEVYSIAIMLDEYCSTRFLNHDIKIFATDIDKDAIEYASLGMYPESIAADADPEVLKKYFIKKGEKYHIIPRIREMIVFAVHNLLKDPPFRSIDLISCRNLLIYLQGTAQKRILSQFQFSLKKGGFLFLGSSEAIGDASRYFQSIDTRWKIFRFKGEHLYHRPQVFPEDQDTARVPAGDDRTHTTPDSGQISTPGPGLNPVSSSKPEQYRHERYVRHERKSLEAVYERLIESELPPGVLVNESREVQHIFGEVNDFLRLPLGRIDLDISKMARNDLEIPLGTALQEARQKKKEIRYTDIFVHGEEKDFSIELSVKPVRDGTGNSYYAIMFHKQDTLHDPDAVAKSFRVDESAQQRIRDLETELQYGRENLQATIEELETSNEELQATNEELLSSNEELQSTNEELQSVNEELITVNAEYQQKIEELSELNDDINNLLASTEIGTIFLDTSLRIRKYTEPITRVISIIPTDLGRPISDLSHNLEYDELSQDIQDVARTRLPRELEVRTKNGVYLLVRIKPYISENQNIKGIVISVIHIDERKKAELALQRQHDLLIQILNSTSSGILMVDGQGRIIYANQSGENILDLHGDELSEKRLDHPSLGLTDLSGRPIPEKELPFSRIVSDGRPVTGYTVKRKSGNGEKCLEIHGNPIYDEKGTVEGAVFNVHEIPGTRGAE